jgi:dolichyl-phosphate-mannose-protein mannosyltransferase
LVRFGPEVYLRLVTLLLSGVLLVLALTINLESAPPLWWDEGWTLSVARNWVKLGHYGRLLDGHPAPRGLEAAFPVTASVALSFRLLGVGIVQARLVAVVYTLAAFALLYELARRFYNRSVGIATLFALILVNGQEDINPLIEGRQILAEVPALVFVLAGYLCFILAEKRRSLFVLTICFWSLALFTKVQLQPFWAIALSTGLIFAVIRGNWKSAKLFAVGLTGSLALYACIQYLFSRFAPSTAISGLTEVIAVVVFKRTRLIVLVETLLYGMPLLIGLCWALWSFLKHQNRLRTQTDMVHFSFFVLAGSWFAWFETLSLGWPRYLFPASFVGSMFVAATLDDWTNHFSLAYTIEKAATALKKLRFLGANLKALAAIVLVVMPVGQTLAVLNEVYVAKADSSIDDTLRFLNTATPRNALIETYESELFFLLNRRYHYPPDKVHIDLIRRNSLGEGVKIDYDPLAANPDYLVVGPQSKFWDFYDPYLKSGVFRLLRTYSRYEIFERVR